MFRRNDDNENESLDFKEFTETVAATGLKLKTSELKQMFSTFDRDGNGSINIDEFLIGLRVRRCLFRKFSQLGNKNNSK